MSASAAPVLLLAVAIMLVVIVPFLLLFLGFGALLVRAVGGLFRAVFGGERDRVQPGPARGAFPPPRPRRPRWARRLAVAVVALVIGAALPLLVLRSEYSSPAPTRGSRLVEVDLRQELFDASRELNLLRSHLSGLENRRPALEASLRSARGGGASEQVVDHLEQELSDLEDQIDAAEDEVRDAERALRDAERTVSRAVSRGEVRVMTSVSSPPDAPALPRVPALPAAPAGHDGARTTIEVVEGVGQPTAGASADRSQALALAIEDAQDKLLSRLGAIPTSDGRSLAEVLSLHGDEAAAEVRRVLDRVGTWSPATRDADGVVRVRLSASLDEVGRLVDQALLARGGDREPFLPAPGDAAFREPVEPGWIESLGLLADRGSARPSPWGRTTLHAIAALLLVGLWVTWSQNTP